MPQDTLTACREIMDRLTKNNVSDMKNEILMKLKDKNITAEERDALLKKLNQILIGNK